MKKNYMPSMEVVKVNVGTEIDKNIKSALIADFPKDFSADIFNDSDSGAVAVSGNKADEGKKYVCWGKDNKLPTAILNRAYCSPYVAPTMNHIVNSLFASGLKPYYVYYVYRKGTVKREQIEYEAAGIWIKARIKELKTEMEPEPKSAFTTGENKTKLPDHTEEISTLEKDYTQWESTYKKWKRFSENNNIPKWLLDQAADLAYFWNWFPAIDLSIGEPGKDWTPEIVGLSHLDATCTRKGIMDSYGKINYCVYSRSFGGQTQQSPSDDPEDVTRQIVIPSLDPDNAVKDLRDKVEKQKGNRNIRYRTTRYVLPMRMYTPGKPYYAMPSWYSIFKGGIYYYLLAILNRRATKLANGTMFSRIIHLNSEYVEYECVHAQAVTEDERRIVYNKLSAELKKWLADPNNNGKALVAMTKTIEGKNVKWVEIETVEPPKDDSSIKDDIGEAANVMLYAQGVHAQTVGAIPGKDKVASGTEARELNSLQQLGLYAQKLMLMYPFYVIKAFNKWDEHLYFDIPMHVLTTLDKNKRGVEEMSN